MEKMTTRDASTEVNLFLEHLTQLQPHASEGRLVDGIVFPVPLYGDVLPTSYGPQLTPRRRIYTERFIDIGTYEVIDQHQHVAGRVDVFFHNMNPCYHAQRFVFATTNPYKRALTAALTTTARLPAVLVYDAYFEDIVDGHYTLRVYPTHELCGRFIIQTLSRQANVCIYAFPYLCFLIVVSM